VRAKKIAAVLSSAAVVALCLPGGAVAHGRLVQVAAGTSNGPTRRDTKATLTQTATLQGTHGYQVKFTLVDRTHLAVSASNRGSFPTGSSFAIYSLRSPQRGEVDEIRARIGHLGRIDVQFVPESVEKEPPFGASCHGDDTIVETGRYVGFLSFRGEHGYTRVRAHRAEGTIKREPPQACRRRTPPPKHDKVVEKEEAETVDKVENEERESDEVHLHGTAAGGAITFSASRMTAKFGHKEQTITNLLAGGSRSLGRIRLVSITLAFSDKGSTFVTPDPLHPTDEAILTATAPFSGSATFRRQPGQAASWTGNLKAELPGFGVVPLTGPGVHASLCLPSTCETRSVFSARRPASVAGLG
jgi:hypothetical protein